MSTETQSTQYLNDNNYTYEYFCRENVCRLCWKITNDAKSTENNATLVQNIEKHIGVSMKGHLLNKVCCACAGEVESFSKFRKCCLETDKKLQLILATGQLKNELKIQNNYIDPKKLKEEVDLELKLLYDQKEEKCDHLESLSGKSTISDYVKDLQIDGNDEFLPIKDRYCYLCDLEFDSDVSKNKHVKVHKIKQDNSYKCYTCKKTFLTFSQKVSHELQCMETNVENDNTTDNLKNNNVNNVKQEYDAAHKDKKCYKLENDGSENDLWENDKSDANDELEMNGARVSKSLLPPIQRQNNEGQKPKRKRNKTKNQVLKTKLFRCQKCLEIFENSSDLKVHRLEKHVNEKAICEVCGKEFNQVSNLKLHLRIHKNDKIKCPHCDYHGTLKDAVDKHIRRVHMRERRFGCHLCPLLCFSKHELSTHLKTHFKIKNFKCTLCPKTYSVKADLQTHIKVFHEGLVAQYKCSYCTSQSTYPDHFRCHLKKKHGIISKVVKGKVIEMGESKTGDGKLETK